jgi:hypothetical protein
MTTNCTNREPSDAEMNDALEALARWQTPGEFASKVKAFDSLVRSSTLFNKANAGFLLDAIPIAAFATHRAVQSVRLVQQRERLNDGQFRNTDETIDIEVTEVMDPGRRRGDEYRCGADQQSVRHFDPHLGETVAKELAKGIKKKADKGYSPVPPLPWHRSTTSHPAHWPEDVGNYWVEAPRSIEGKNWTAAALMARFARAQRKSRASIIGKDSM